MAEKRSESLESHMIEIVRLIITSPSFATGSNAGPIGLTSRKFSEGLWQHSLSLKFMCLLDFKHRLSSAVQVSAFKAMGLAAARAGEAVLAQVREMASSAARAPEPESAVDSGMSDPGWDSGDRRRQQAPPNPRPSFLPRCLRATALNRAP
jgi:hypothetical protein